MERSRISKDALRAMASLSGLELSDERLEELLPVVQRSADMAARLDELDLEGVEPAIIFKAHGE